MEGFLQLLAQYITELLPWRVTAAYEWGVRSARGRRPDTPLETGFHICIPGYHTYHEVPRTPQVIKLGKQSMITKDGVCIVFSANVVIQVVEPIAHFFEVHDFDEAMKDIAMQHLGDRVHALTYKQEDGAPVDLDASLLRSLRTTLETRLRDWGTKVLSVGFVDFVPTEHQVRLFQDDVRAEGKLL